MVKSGEAAQQLPLIEMTSPDPTLQVLLGPEPSSPMCYLSELVTVGKSIIFSLWGPAAGVGRGANGHHLEQNE